jgi:hypothetical protein
MTAMSADLPPGDTLVIGDHDGHQQQVSEKGG